MSYIKCFTLMLTTFFSVLSFLALIIAIIVDGKVEFKTGALVSILICLVFQFVFIELLYYLFSKYGKSRIIISENRIQTRAYIINTDEAEIFYNKLNLINIISNQGPELIAVINNERILIGLFTNREIKKMKRFIPHIKINPNASNK